MLLSVVIPVYNTRPYLEQLIGSFHAQTAQNFELIVVNDASTDGSGAFLHEMATTTPWIHYFDRPHTGLSAARNFGLSHCRGDVIALADSDDWVSETYVEDTLRPFRQTDCQWTMRPVYLVFEDGIFINQARYDETVTTQDAAGCFIKADTVEERLRWWPSVWNKAFRREMIMRNWFDEGMLFEDHAFNIRNYALESCFLALPKPLYYHRRERAGQITAQAGAINLQIFRCFDLWEKSIRNLTITDKPAYLQGLTERLFNERINTLGTSAERVDFQTRFREWKKVRNQPSMAGKAY